MKLYNTLTRKVEKFTPLDADQVSFYSCGPTVYDYPHIGNWYTFIRYDLLHRVLKEAGYKVTWVMNITDVGHLVSDADDGEDKLEKGAKREGSNAWDIAKKYTDNFMQGLQKLNIQLPDHLPKATDHILEQIELIKQLETNGFIYIINDGAYFDTSKFSDYGKMAQLDIDNLQEGARVKQNKQKKNPTDFALWKFSPIDKKRDMEWESPWGKGFPGWHLECSAMSMKYLGKTIDIHAGGIDHIPVHHTNEIAQSEAATGKQFSRFWVHNNFNLVDGRKMAKSANNFYTLEDLEQKGYDLLAFRLLVMQSHYRTEAHFTWGNLEAAQNRLNNWRSAIDLLWQEDKAIGSGIIDTEYTDPIKAALLDDLDTPKALALIDKAIDEIQNFQLCKPCIKQLAISINDLFGINLLEGKSDVSSEQKELLKDRQAARQKKDFDESDRIRNELLKQGIDVRDTNHGQVWSRVSL